MARRSNSRKAARSAKRARNHRTKTSTLGRSLYRRPLRIEPLEDRRLLALTVTTLEDGVDPDDGVTSLREALFAANTTPGADTIEFAPELTSGGPKTLLLTQGELFIAETVTIMGPGAALLAIDAQQQSGVFRITAAAGDVSLVGLTVKNGLAISGGGISSVTLGTLRLNNMVVEGNQSFSDGGGIFTHGVVSMHNSSVRNNHSLSGNASGGGIYAANGFEAWECSIEGNTSRGNGAGVFVRSATTFLVADSWISENRHIAIRASSGQDGGGIYVRLADGTIGAIVNSVITTNFAGSGGGIYVAGGEMRLASSVISRNVAELSGGGVRGQGAIHIANCQIEENSASSGGGVSAAATILGSTFVGNHASSNGGAISGTEIRAEDSTFSGNSADSSGGAIYASSRVDLIRSTVSDNEAGVSGGGLRTLNGSLQSSIVAGNRSSASSRDIGRVMDPGTNLVATYSLIGYAGGSGLAETGPSSPDASGNLIGGDNAGPIDPLLAPLTYNGGFALPGGALLRTHALLIGSPAIGAGNPSDVAGMLGVPEFDQRGAGFGRVVGGRIDIGSLEQQPSMQLDLVVDTLVDESDGDFSDGDLSLREAIELTNVSNFDGVVDTIAFDPTVFGAPGPHTILLTKGALVITDALDIAGPGSAVLIVDASGNDATPGDARGDGSQGFVVDDLNDSSFVAVSLTGMTIRGGDGEYGGGILSAEHLTISGSQISDNFSETLGGGVLSIGGNLTITDSTISGNRAGADGGGVASFYGNFTLTDSTLSGNAARSGGGLYASGGEVTIEHSRVANNSASTEIGVGGGIQATTSNLVLRRSIVTGNTARDAGGIYSGQSLELIDSAVSQNTATRNGAGIANHGALYVAGTTLSGNRAGGSGGGIWSVAEVDIENSTIARNSATESGGGAWLEVDFTSVSLLQVTVSGNQSAGPGAGLWINDRNTAAGAATEIRHSTIAMNEAAGSGIGGGIFLAQGAVALKYSIVAKNSASIAQDLAGLIGASFSARYCVIGDNTGSGLTATSSVPDSNGNLIGTGIAFVDIYLNELAYNGGRTPTHALQTFSLASPALNAGEFGLSAGTGGVPTHDQRGAPYTRISGDRIDIGAFESSPSTLLAGDYSRNGVVDARDYALWRNQFGASVEPGTGADGNGDGVVDDFDYAVWKLNFGMTAGGQGASLGARPDGGGAGQEAKVASFGIAEELPTVARSAITAAPDVDKNPTRSVVLDRNAGRARSGTEERANALRRDLALEGWVTGRAAVGVRSKHPHPGSLPKGEGEEAACANALAAVDGALAEMGGVRLVFAP